jgi:hypothetical protein
MQGCRQYGKGMRKAQLAKLIEELRLMRPDLLPVKKTETDLEQEHTKASDEEI